MIIYLESGKICESILRKTIGTVKCQPAADIRYDDLCGHYS